MLERVPVCIILGPMSAPVLNKQNNSFPNLNNSIIYKVHICIIQFDN